MKIIKYIFLLFLFLYSYVHAEPVQPPKWKTKIDLPNNSSAIMTWTAIYEGRNSVENIVVKSNDKTTKIFSGLAQPVFNKNNSFVALPYCEDGGCEKEIRIIDLVNLSEKKPIQLPQPGQLEIDECKWEGINILKIRLQYYVQPSPMEAFFVYNAYTEELKLEKERVYDQFRRD